MHRLINPYGDLELLVIMANSGLPERGDNVVCFTNEWLSDQTHYDEAMQVKSVTDAYQRRDRGVMGFLQLKEAFEIGLEQGRTALREFYESAAVRTGIRRPEWAEIIAAGSAAEVQTNATAFTVTRRWSD